MVALGAPVCSTDAKRYNNLDDDEYFVEQFDDIMTQSDSSDYKHEGNGIPCWYNNHDGCKHGSKCHFKHAPDIKSVRDEL